MLKIEVKTNQVETFSGISKKTGNPFSISKQEGWLHGKDAYPVKLELMLKDENKPYQTGFYRLDIDQSIYLDRNGRLSISPVLVSIAEKAAA